MFSQLEGKASVSVLCIAKDAAAVTALTEFFECHMEFMKAKRETEGPQKLLHYSISSSPEWEGEGIAEIVAAKGHSLPAKQSFTFLKFMKLKKVLIIIGKKQIISSKFEELARVTRHRN